MRNIASMITQSLDKSHANMQTKIELQLRRNPEYDPGRIKAKSIVVPSNYDKFNAMIGLPINKNTKKRQKMTEYQVTTHLATELHHKIIENKSRKIGASEGKLRSIALNVFHRYEGHDICTIAGNKLEIAKELLIRFDELFHDKRQPDDGMYSFKDVNGNKWKYNEIIRRASIHGSSPIVEFRNDTRHFCFAASKQGQSQPLRGPDDIICIFLSEAAHTGPTHDKPIMNALLPNLANRDDADFIQESTPNGKRGFYYEYWSAMLDILEQHYGSLEDIELLRKLWNEKNKAVAEKLNWYPLLWSYKIGLEYKILSQKFIMQMQRDPGVDFQQEFENRFTTTRTAAFTEEDFAKYLPPGQEVEDYSKTILQDRYSDLV